MKHDLLILMFSAMVASVCAYAQEAPRLLPFQGRLTDQDGVAVSNGVRLVQFKIFTEATGGSPVWAGELHRTTVNGGLVNVMLGTKTPLAFDFDRQLYLEITVDINADNSITLADPPMLPRQVILPVIFAKESGVSRDSQKLNGADWTPIFGANNPNLPIPASKLADASLPASKIHPGSITSNQIASQTINASLIAPATITSNQIANGSISVSNLVQQVAEALNPPGTIVAYGGETIPAGWLLCDGTMQLISVYPRLSQALGVRWGTNSATQFRLPDLRGVFLRGVTGSRNDGFQDPGDGRAGIFGSASSQGVGSYQSDALKIHDHTIKRRNVGSSGSTVISIYADAGGQGYVDPFPTKVINDAGNSTESRPKNAYVNYIIKY